MKKYLEEDNWKIIERTLHTEYNQISESIASLGNGRLGGRGNFEEKFNGPSLQGSYIAGIYYPDKTKVGWWKNGYPEYFAKVINSVNWIGVDVWIDGHDFELHPEQVTDFTAELDMKEGILRRKTEVTLEDGKKILIESERFYSMHEKDRCFLRYSVTPLNFSGKIKLAPYLDFNVTNQDSNYDEVFWNHLETKSTPEESYVYSSTKKTDFHVHAGMQNRYFLNDTQVLDFIKSSSKEAFAESSLTLDVMEGEKFTVEKYVVICSSLYYPIENLKSESKSQLAAALDSGYEAAKKNHIARWDEIWSDCDITVQGDIAAQQGIRFNIFQLFQTYTGEDARLNIGPKGFTGEKYGGVTYWDTEAYCLPFYMSTASQQVAKNLLIYRHNHLPKAIENAEKLGFKNGAALYPMVTMTGEECHNEWEITFEEIHRNAAIAFAIYDYIRYTGDTNHLHEYGLEVLIGIARFWRQRVNWSADKQRFVILGVTGPNEYENNVNNNWYTNYAACWCLNYCIDALNQVKESNYSRFEELVEKTGLDYKNETKRWQEVIDSMYFPHDTSRGIFLQQEGFLDKSLSPASQIPEGEYPIHQNWSWDRILRSCYIKQADVLQGLYFFEDHFDTETIRKNFNFYEPLTVHESSLSPCVHSILAALIGNHDKAYEMYLRTARLDLDDYNNDTKDGLHITSMAGTWMAFVKGFGGMRVKEDKLSFTPFIPDNWSSYSFKIKFRGQVVKLLVTNEASSVINLSEEKITVLINDKETTIYPQELKSIV
jgi:maltose phosphorylase